MAASSPRGPPRDCRPRSRHVLLALVRLGCDALRSDRGCSPGEATDSVRDGQHRPRDQADHVRRRAGPADVAACRDDRGMVGHPIREREHPDLGAFEHSVGVGVASLGFSPRVPTARQRSSRIADACFTLRALAWLVTRADIPDGARNPMENVVAAPGWMGLRIASELPQHRRRYGDIAVGVRSTPIGFQPLAEAALGLSLDAVRPRLEAFGEAPFLLLRVGRRPALQALAETAPPCGSALEPIQPFGERSGVFLESQLAHLRRQRNREVASDRPRIVKSRSDLPDACGSAQSEQLPHQVLRSSLGWRARQNWPAGSRATRTARDRPGGRSCDFRKP
jgi:hypothetical protein